MNLDIWVFLEWFGALLALFGAILMATQKTKPFYPWIIWLVSNISFLILFNHTQQYGLFLLNLGGFFINLFGLYQWFQHEEHVNKKITNLLLCFVFIFLLISGYNIYEFLINPNIKNAEWIGSTLGLSGAFLLASRHKYSFLCWFVWLFSNIVLFIVTLKTQQYAFVLLQSGFTISNFLGVWHWFKKYNKTKVFDNIEFPTQP